MSNKQAVFRPMTAREIETALALGKCSFPPASFSKRFAKDISLQAQHRGQITEAQAKRLAIQAYIYRRQMPPELVPAAAPEGYQTPRQRSAEALSQALAKQQTDGSPL